nr:hypothetical protein [Candidatus Sigynarchaeota archaeon]
MPLDDFARQDPPPKKASTKKQPLGGDIAKPGKEDETNLPDRQKIALLKKLLQDKNVVIESHRSSTKITENMPSMQANGDFLVALERFAEWIRGRTFIRGDIDTAKQMIANLVSIDKSLLPPSAAERTAEKFLDLAEFLKEVKQHDSLHPDDAVLSKQEFSALMKRKQGTPLTSTDYRYLKFLKDRVKGNMKKMPFYAFLASFLDIPEI